MPRLTQQSIEQVRRMAPIYDVVSGVVALKKAGRKWSGLSPFTSEKTASFYVDPDKNLWYCFSSQKGGDVIKFVMEREGLPFVEAVESLAERFRIALEYEEGGGAGGPSGSETRSLRKQLLEIHDYATEWFHAQFAGKTPAGEAIREYWTTGRKFTPAVAAEYRIGLAPPDGGNLLEVLLRRGFGVEALAQSGLFYAPEGARDARRLRPRFRGRLMIPIREHVHRQVVAFTARQTALTPVDDPTAKAKYVNSPETPIFHKGRLVFGLDRAREVVATAKEKGRFLMVEGQLDCIRCHTVGLGFAVAGQGTAITPEHLDTLRRIGDGLDVLLDRDRAGQAAALRLLPMALAAGLEVRFLALPEGKDPDDLFAAQGAAAWPSLVASAMEPIPFAAQGLIQALPNPGDPVQRAKAAAQLAELLAGLPPELRGAYASAIASAFGLAEHEARLLLRKSAPARASNSAPTPPQRSAAEEIWQGALTSSSGMLLVILLHHPTLLSAVAQVLEPEAVGETDRFGRLLARMLGDWMEGLWTSVEDFVLAVTDAEREVLGLLLAKPWTSSEPHTEVTALVRRLLSEHLRRQQQALELTLSRAGLVADQRRAALQQVRLLSDRLQKVSELQLPTV